MSRFFCLYIADFPAWARLRFDPALQNRALVIYASGRVRAASHEAYQAGIKLDWSLERAKALVPDLTCLPSDAALEITAWQEVLALLYEATPRIESIRHGLAFADVRKSSEVVPLVHSLGLKAGLADDRCVAELAARTTESGKLRVIRPGYSVVFLSRVPVGIFEELNVSREAVQWLGWMGWKNIAHLRSISRSHLTQQFKREGEILYRYAQANDKRIVPWYTPPAYLAEHYDFELGANEPYEWEPVLLHLIDQVASQLEGWLAHSIHVVINVKGSRLQQRRLLRDGTANGRVLYAAAESALCGLIRPNAAITRLEVGLGSLALPKPMQLGLFRSARPSTLNVIRALENRFPNIAKRVILLDQNAYLPENSFRFEPLKLDEVAPPPSKKKTKQPARTFTPRGTKTSKQKEAELQLVMS